MKKLFTLLLILFFGQIIGQNNNLFYYSYNVKKFLTPVDNMYIVELPSQVDSTFFSSRNVTAEKLTNNLYKVNAPYDSIYNGNNNIAINSVYNTSLGNEILMFNQIALKWKQSTTQLQKDNLLAQFSLVHRKTNRLFSIYDINNPLFISQFIYETGLLEYCYPVFMADIDNFDIPLQKLNAENKKISNDEKIQATIVPSTVLNSDLVLDQYFPNDEYFNQQFYFHNTGQILNDGLVGTPDADIDAPEAWAITKGSPNIVIAIIDQGITDNHIDLPSSRQIRLPNSNFAHLNFPSPSNNPNDPTPYLLQYTQYHGNACAGVLAAEENGEGIMGLAPLCKVMPIKRQIGSVSWSELSETLIFAVDNGANIISCSWGGAGDPDCDPSMIDAIRDAIANNVSVMFASGNTANHLCTGVNNPNLCTGWVAFPANSNVQGLITVGASDRNNMQSNYSVTDESIDIVATSSTDIGIYEKSNVWSMDLPGVSGLNPRGNVFLPSSGIVLDHYLDFTGNFGGTSAATPIIAGVAALMLSVNPCLSTKQITSTMFNSVDKVGGYDYNWSPERPGHSRELGYGKVNAYTSVHNAQLLNSETLDLMISDTPEDLGIQPNTSSQFFWNSQSIWVRNIADGIEQHQNPEYSTTLPNYVYVKVSNKSCVTSTESDHLSIYWAKAGTSLNWPSVWNNEEFFNNNATMGRKIATVDIPILAPGEEKTIQIEWLVPNPEDYVAVNPEPWHFCLLARIESVADPMLSETGDLFSNVQINNNIAWKNVSIVDLELNLLNETTTVGATIAVGNPFNSPKDYYLELVRDNSEKGKPVYDEAEVSVKMDNIVYDAWVRGGKKLENAKLSTDEKTKIVTGNNMLLDNIQFNAKETGTIVINFNFLTKELTEKSKFTYHVIQRKKTTNQIIGGETFVIKKNPRSPFNANAGGNKEVEKNHPIIISANQISEPAIYNWYDPMGNLVFTGKDMNVSASVTIKYKLEVIALADGFKDYDDVTIQLKPSKIESISPNPVTNDVLIKYKANDVTSAYLMILNYYTGTSISNNYILNVENNEIQFNAAAYPNGLYTIALVCDGNILDAKVMIKQ